MSIFCTIFVSCKHLNIIVRNSVRQYSLAIRPFSYCCTFQRVRKTPVQLDTFDDERTFFLPRLTQFNLNACTQKYRRKKKTFNLTIRVIFNIAWKKRVRRNQPDDTNANPQTRTIVSRDKRPVFDFYSVKNGTVSRSTPIPHRRRYRANINDRVG